MDLNNVAAAFVESGRRSPIIDVQGKTHIHIDHQMKGYKIEDPTKKHEKVLPLIAFHHRLVIATLPRELVSAWLLCSALFSIVCSYKYTYVEKGEQKTQHIRVCTIVFRNGSQVISHKDPLLYLAESVPIDFGDQKSDIKDKIISQGTNNSPKLNPVWLFACTVRRIISHPGFFGQMGDLHLLKQHHIHQDFIPGDTK